MSSKRIETVYKRRLEQDTTIMAFGLDDAHFVGPQPIMLLSYCGMRISTRELILDQLLDL